MSREYELWLDESESFTNERKNARDKKRFPGGFHPSMIGGWLIKYDPNRRYDFSEYVIESPASDDYHAAGMKNAEDKQKVIGGIKYVREVLGGKTVIFQNKELMDYGNRELYLR